MSRDDKGNIGWSVLALLLGIIVLPVMLVREVYQSLEGDFPLEWGDVFRYGFLICLFSGFHWCFCEYFELPIWTWF